MLTSQKKTKTRKILGVVLGFCCLTLIAGCTLDKKDEPVVPSDKNNSQTVVNEFKNIKVQTKISTPIYVVLDGQLVEGGTLEANTYLDIDDADAQGDTIPIKGSSWYVRQSDVMNSERWFKNQTHLVPFHQAINTNEAYTLEDVYGTVVATRTSGDSYQIYVQPNESDPRYGVLFQQGVYYIPATDVKGVMERASDQSMELATSVPVMMYHFFYDESVGEKRLDVNYVEVNELREQAEYLVNNNFTSLTMHEVRYFMEERAQVPEKSYALTIDDGHESVFKYAYPILKEYGINATMFLITGWMDPAIPYEFIEMKEEGIEMQSHSFLMHQGGCSGMGHGGRIQCVDYNEGVEDTVRAYEYVDKGFVYCYPFGDVNENAIQIMKDSGTKLAFTTEFGKIKQGMDVYRLPRIRVTGGAGINQYTNHLK